MKLEWKLTVQGGFLKKAQVVDVIRREVAGQEVQFVEISPSTTWLCEMVTGQYAAHKPLARTQALDRLKLEPIAEAGKPDSMMQALDYDDDEAPQKDVETPAKKSRKGRLSGLSPNVKPPLRAEGVSIVPLPDVLGPAPPPTMGMTPRTVVVCREGNRWFIDAQALSWLVQHLAKEVELGGVAQVKGPSPSKTAKPSMTWWDMANNIWRAKCLDHNQEQQTTSMSVHRRRSASGDLRELSWEGARAKVHEELLEWILATSGKQHEEEQ